MDSESDHRDTIVNVTDEGYKSLTHLYAYLSLNFSVSGSSSSLL